MADQCIEHTQYLSENRHSIYNSSYDSQFYKTIFVDKECTQDENILLFGLSEALFMN